MRLGVRAWAAVWLALLGPGRASAQDPEPTACVAPQLLPAAELDRHARTLAGLPGGVEAAGAAAHAAAMDQSFGRLDRGQFSRIRAWSAASLPMSVHAAEVVWYPFSGPDVLYPAALFPQARQLLLTGLEPVGAPPSAADFAGADGEGSLAELRQSLGTLLGKSFFVTAQMQQQFARNRFRGVTPVLMLLLARAGFQIDSATAVVLSADGRLCARAFADRVDNAGVVIGYHGSDGVERRLSYLRVDLSDQGLQAMPGYALLVQRFGVQVSYLKSASYLLHTAGFSQIRALLLAQSPALLQDDSGIPYREFDPSAWTATLYGHYQQAASGFGGHTQPALRKAFAGAPPLPFWIGYRHSKDDSNLQLYQRR